MVCVDSSKKSRMCGLARMMDAPATLCTCTSPGNVPCRSAGQCSRLARHFLRPCRSDFNPTQKSVGINSDLQSPRCTKHSRADPRGCPELIGARPNGSGIHGKSCAECASYIWSLPMRTCLLVIDAQESFRYRPYFSARDVPAYLDAQNGLIEGARRRGIPIVRVFHVERDPQSPFAVE